MCCDEELLFDSPPPIIDLGSTGSAGSGATTPDENREENFPVLEELEGWQ